MQKVLNRMNKIQGDSLTMVVDITVVVITNDVLAVLVTAINIDKEK